MKIELQLNDVVVIDENHGGYLGGHCIACKASGWIEGRYGIAASAPKRGAHLCHTKTCPVNKLITATGNKK